MQKKRTIIIIGQVIGVSLSVFLISFVVFSWTGPVTNPPDGNVDAPINTGSSDQSKTGGLTLAAVTVTGDLVANNTTLGNCAWTSSTCDDSATCPSNKLVVGIQRHTGSALCGTAPTQWYRQSIYCCNL